MCTSMPMFSRQYRNDLGVLGTIYGGRMAEHVAQMGPMLLVAGLAVGWMGEAFARAGGYGLLRDMALGISGSVFCRRYSVGFVVDGLGMVSMLMTGALGTVVLVAAQRQLWRSRRG